MANSEHKIIEACLLLTGERVSIVIGDAVHNDFYVQVLSHDKATYTDCGYDLSKAYRAFNEAIRDIMQAKCPNVK